MAGDIQIKDNSIQEALNKLNNAINKIEGVHSELTSKNNQLDRTWEGESKEKYYKQYNKIAEKYSDYVEDLKKMKDDLNIILETFEEADNKAGKQISNIN